MLALINISCQALPTNTRYVFHKLKPSKIQFFTLPGEYNALNKVTSTHGQKFTVFQS